MQGLVVPIRMLSIKESTYACRFVKPLTHSRSPRVAFLVEMSNFFPFYFSSTRKQKRFGVLNPTVWYTNEKKKKKFYPML